MRNISPWFSLLAFVCVSPALANPTWDGTWSGVLKSGDAVSVTISDGKVTAYAVRGVEPFGIEYSRITATTVAFGDREHFSVKLYKRGVSTAFGTAHSPMGDGFASLTRQ